MPGRSSASSTSTSRRPRPGSSPRTTRRRTSSRPSSTTSRTASVLSRSRFRPICRRRRLASWERSASPSTWRSTRSPTARRARPTESRRRSRSSRAWTSRPRPLEDVTDTHAHLDACADPPPELVARARAAGIDRIVAVGSGLDSCRETLAIARREPGVWAALGIHPHQAGDPDAERLDELRELLGDERAVAVGETGLDFYRDYAPHDLQRELFARQLDLAAELGKPVVVHTRNADEQTAAALERFPGTVVLHCFSSP